MGVVVFQALYPSHIGNKIFRIAFDFLPFLVWQVLDFVYYDLHLLSADNGGGGCCRPRQKRALAPSPPIVFEKCGSLIISI